nr:hypothetical protein [Solirubrobacterales bacterium]
MPDTGNTKTHGARRHRFGRLAPLAAIVLGAAAFAAPASAAPVAPAGAQEMTIFSDSNVVIGGGLTPGSVVDVVVLRGGTPIGTASGLTVTPAGDVEVNHGPDQCFDGQTPDILAGDVVQILTGPDTGIQMTVADVTINEPTRTGDVQVTGTVVPGAGEFLVRLVKGNGASHLEAPGGPGTSVTFGPGDAYTATFTAPADPTADIEARVLDGNAVTIAEPAGANACGPVATSAITSASPSVVNFANQGSPVQVSGVVA